MLLKINLLHLLDFCFSPLMSSSPKNFAGVTFSINQDMGQNSGSFADTEGKLAFLASAFSDGNGNTDP